MVGVIKVSSLLRFMENQLLRHRADNTNKERGYAFYKHALGNFWKFIISSRAAIWSACLWFIPGTTSSIQWGICQRRWLPQFGAMFFFPASWSLFLPNNCLSPFTMFLTWMYMLWKILDQFLHNQLDPKASFIKGVQSGRWWEQYKGKTSTCAKR